MPIISFVLHLLIDVTTFLVKQFTMLSQSLVLTDKVFDKVLLDLNNPALLKLPIYSTKHVTVINCYKLTLTAVTKI